MVLQIVVEDKALGRYRNLPDDTPPDIERPDIDRLSDATLLQIFVYTQSTYASPPPERGRYHTSTVAGEESYWGTRLFGAR